MSLKDKAAQRVYNQRYYAATAEKQKTKAQAKYWADPEKARAYTQKYASTNREKLRERRRRGSMAAKYGITPEEFDALVIHQLGRCDGCGEELGKKLYIDHCHTTGRVRGLLCRRCNTALGMSREDPATLRALAVYAEKHAP